MLSYHYSRHYAQEKQMTTRQFQGITLYVESETVRGVTVETISFMLNGKAVAFRGAYGSAQRAAERAIYGGLNISVCQSCGTPLANPGSCDWCYSPARFGGEVPAGVDW